MKDQIFKNQREFDNGKKDCSSRLKQFCHYSERIHPKNMGCNLCEYVNCPRAPQPISQEEVPDGIDIHTVGAKADSGKVKAGVLGDFGLALMEVAKIGTGGLEKYSRGGWQHVVDGTERYGDAAWRHLLKKRYVVIDKDFGLRHMSHLAWNVLAELELILRDYIEEEVRGGKDRDEVIEELMVDMGTVYKDK